MRSLGHVTDPASPTPPPPQLLHLQAAFAPQKMHTNEAPSPPLTVKRRIEDRGVKNTEGSAVSARIRESL